MTVTEAEVKSILVAINCVFPGRSKLDPETIGSKIQVWHDLLRDITSGQALAACRSVLMEAVHPPTPGEIRRRALKDQLESPTGADAWGEVCNAISRYGMYRTPQWSSPAVGLSVNAIGGWKSICTSGNTIADRARFIEHFDANMRSAKQSVLTGASSNIATAIDERQQRIQGVSMIAGLLRRGES